MLVVGLLGGIGLALFAQTLQGQALAGAFYGAGALLLIAGIAALALVLRQWALRDSAALDLGSLGRRNAVRRRGRSLAVAGIMASGVFMVMAVNSFRIGFDDSGTGGFKWIGSSTLPIYENLNTQSGQDAHGLDPLPAGGEIVSLRVRQGAEASCLNLNRAQQPRLVAVNPERLAEREAFIFAKGGSWQMLEGDAGDGTVPGIADMNSAMWAMGKKLGDVVSYPAADGELQVRLVAFLQGSVLQGNVIISEDSFKAAYPDAGGYQMFLIDLPGGEGGEEARKDLTRQLQARGLELISAADRLADYNRVQNTYISIFTVLGGLGVLLGTVGVALVIGRNVLERRGELALMGAQGFRRAQLARMVLSEHWFLLVAGIVIGVVSSLVAVLPNLLNPSAGLPVGLIAGLTATIIAAGLAFCWLATRLALRGNLVESLRAE